MANLVKLDLPATSHITREVLGWQPKQASLLEDIDNGKYFPAS